MTAQLTTQQQIREWCKKNSYSFGDADNLFVELLRNKLTDDQILFVLQKLDLVCANCFDAVPGCHCANDE